MCAAHSLEIRAGERQVVESSFSTLRLPFNASRAGRKPPVKMAATVDRPSGIETIIPAHGRGAARLALPSACAASREGAFRGAPHFGIEERLDLG
jgi:hypothetical protein